MHNRPPNMGYPHYQAVGGGERQEPPQNEENAESPPTHPQHPNYHPMQQPPQQFYNNFASQQYLPQQVPNIVGPQLNFPSPPTHDMVANYYQLPQQQYYQQQQQQQLMYPNFGPSNVPQTSNMVVPQQFPRKTPPKPPQKTTPPKKTSTKPQMSIRQQVMSQQCEADPPGHADDPRLIQIATKVLDETSVLEGDRTFEWASRAVRLIAKTTRKYGCFDVFYEAIMSEHGHSKCCPAHNDKLPGGIGRANMFILRLFRFPWLRYDIQIKSTLNCRYPVDRGTRSACLNPYHYRLVELPRLSLPPIVVNKTLDYGEPPMRPENPMDDESSMNEHVEDEEVVAEFTVPNVTIKGDEIKMLFEQHADHDTNYDLNSLAGLPMPPNFGQMASGLSMAPFDPNLLPGSSVPMPSADIPSFAVPFPPRPQSETEEDTECKYYQSGLSSPARYNFSDIASPTSFVPNLAPPPPTRPECPSSSVSPLDEQMETDEDVDEEMREVVQMTRAAAESVPGRPKKDKPRYADGRPITPIEPRPLFRSSVSELGELVRNAATFECVEYEEKSKWLALMYYEESNQIGEVKEFERAHCLIDGYTSTETDTARMPTRFSIGFFNNPIRSPATSEVRSLIGKGCRLYLLAGEVYIENLCGIPIFVQSISANLKNGFAMNTVSKLPPQGTMKVFDMRMFSKQLAAAATKTYQDVYCLSRMCTIRISFCKGWGEHYRRSTVLRSPVWLQAHLHNPMSWIDSVLTCMGAPPRLCTSRS
ncbi:unnamed protein product [Caenorhabditis sp. 36 PRJEB53466]|nr:unnamed protein product [Caenorhabditis sp. 36 PRJEB53466]